MAVHVEIAAMMKRRLGRVPERWIWNYAYAVVDARGADRARIHRHGPRLLAALAWGYLRWTGGVPPRSSGARGGRSRTRGAGRAAGAPA